MVKIGDIAKATGFSITTVSKALNGYSDISDKTKKIVIETAKQMGYVPNASARSLVMKRSFTVGIILEDGSGYGLEHPFFASVIQTFKRYIEKKGYDALFIANGLGDTPVDSYLNHCVQRGVDGILICCTNIENEGVQELLNSNLPSVMLDNPDAGINCIHSDNYPGAVEAMEYLISLGHKQIAHIYGDTDVLPGKERNQAYIDVMDMNGLEVKAGYLQDGGYFEFDKGHASMERLLDLAEPPTAVFAASDIIALGAMKSCYERRLRVPDDISIIGFDNVRMLDWTTPRLTSVSQDTEILGMECAKMLVEKIEKPNDKKIEIVKVPTKLIYGKTCREVK